MKTHKKVKHYFFDMSPCGLTKGCLTITERTTYNRHSIILDKRSASALKRFLNAIDTIKTKRGA